MNEQYVNPDIVERTNNDMNTPEVNLNPSADKVLMDEELNHHDRPMEETVVHETSLDETVVYESPVDETVVHETPVEETITHETPISTNTGSSTSLLNREESEHFRTRWNEIQGIFVDEPRSAVEQADALVTEVIELITQTFANEHRTLEGQWNHGNEVSTEDLRMVLQRYRSFFNSLVV